MSDKAFRIGIASALVIVAVVGLSSTAWAYKLPTKPTITVVVQPGNSYVTGSGFTGQGDIVIKEKTVHGGVLEKLNEGADGYGDLTETPLVCGPAGTKQQVSALDWTSKERAVKVKAVNLPCA